MRLPEAEAEQVIALAIARVESRRASMPGSRDWRSTARPEQIPPDDYRLLYFRGGRGGGKTWSGAHVLAEMIEEDPGEYAVVAPTYADARDKCVEGPSGLLAALGTTRLEVDRGASLKVASWNRSLHDMRLRNGSVVWADGADDGAPTIQGLNLKAAWCDEVGLWKRWQIAWEEAIRYAVRISPSRIIATGTPKRSHPLVRDLMADETVVKRLLRTVDNIANLDESLVNYLIKRYGGTTLGRQELEGEMLTDVPGAMVQRAWIDQNRRAEVPVLRRIVVAIDPSASSTEEAAEAGIVVAGKFDHPPDDHESKPHEHFAVLDDVSLRGTPAEWGLASVAAYNKYKADVLVGEINNGGKMVGFVIGTIDKRANFKEVTASRGKQIRAEPISALYEKGLVHHVGFFADLEDQWASWVPGEGDSPDRIDACVWALTELSTGHEPGVLGLYRAQREARAAKEA